MNLRRRFFPMLAAVASLAVVFVGSTAQAYPLKSSDAAFYPIGFPNGKMIMGTFDAKLADVTGDGRADFITVNEALSNVAIMVANSDGTFQSPITFTGVTTPSELKVVDFNGDGALDLVITSLNQAVALFVNNGGGSFTLQATIPVGASVVAAVPVFRQVNNVNITDIAIVTANQEVIILKNDGAGSFTRQQPITLSTVPVTAAAGYVDGNVQQPDFQQDILIGSSDNSISVLLSNGDGTFTVRESTYTMTDRPVKFLSVSAVNQDGNNDVAVQTVNNLSVLFGNGDGTFGSSNVYASNAKLVTIVATSFGAGDEIADFVAVNKDKTVTVFVNSRDGSGTFSQLPSVGYSFASTPLSAVAEIFDGTNMPSVLIRTASEVVVLTQYDGQGRWAQMTIHQVGPYSDLGSPTEVVAVGDSNGDHALDVAVLDNRTIYGDNGFTAFVNDGNGSFQPSHYSLNVLSYAVKSADVNGDGFVDVVTANYATNDVSIFLGNGHGAFAVAQNFAAGKHPTSVAIADVNGDQKPDVLTASKYDRALLVLLGNGDGTFQAPQSTPVSPYLASLVVRDFNKDGKMDVAAIASIAAGQLYVLSGNGDGTFVQSLNVPTGMIPQEVDSFYSNGADHIVVANYTSNNISVFVNDGTGNFAPEVRYSVDPDNQHINNPTALAVGDVNDDGKYDVVVANSNHDAGSQVGFGHVSIFISNGDNTFKPAVNYTLSLGAYAAANPYGIQVADMNGDKKNDILVSLYGSNAGLAVLVNNGNEIFSSDGSGGDQNAHLFAFRDGNGNNLMGGPMDVTTADFNGDGRADVATADFIGSGFTAVVNTVALTQVTAQPISDQELTIQWTDATHADSYAVQLSYDGVMYGKVHPVSGGVFSTTINGLNPNTKYWVRVGAVYNGLGVDYTTVSQPVYTFASVPENVQVTGGDKQVVVSWTGNATEYFVENTTAGTNSGWGTGSQYTFINLTCGTDYAFQVKGKNAAGVETAFTQPAAVKTNPCPVGGGNNGGGGGGGSFGGGFGGVSGVSSAPHEANVSFVPGSFDTTANTVNLLLSATNSPTQMILSSRKDFSDTYWIAFASTTAWKFSSTDTDVTVFAKFRNNGGESEVASTTMVVGRIDATGGGSTATTTGSVLGTKITRLDQLIAMTKFGQRGALVSELQTELKKLGFFPQQTTVTGYYGSITRIAVEKYMLGKLTLDELIAKLVLGNYGPLVVRLQTELKKLGFFPQATRITGYYGKITQIAVEKYKVSK